MSYENDQGIKMLLKFVKFLNFLVSWDENAFCKRNSQKCAIGLKKKIQKIVFSVIFQLFFKGCFGHQNDSKSTFVASPRSGDDFSYHHRDCTTISRSA
jgi:hypothetical protein